MGASCAFCTFGTARGGRLSDQARNMVTITFPDRETEKRALAFLLGQFSGRVLRSGEHLVPEAALEALADQNISFTSNIAVVDSRATWSEHDQDDLTAFFLQYAATLYPESEELV